MALASCPDENSCLWQSLVSLGTSYFLTPFVAKQYQNIISTISEGLDWTPKFRDMPGDQR